MKTLPLIAAAALIASAGAANADRPLQQWLDLREDRIDARVDFGPRDRIEDRIDRRDGPLSDRLDRYDRREDRRDRRVDRGPRDRLEDRIDRRF